MAGAVTLPLLDTRSLTALCEASLRPTAMLDLVGRAADIIYSENGHWLARGSSPVPFKQCSWHAFACTNVGTMHSSLAAS